MKSDFLKAWALYLPIITLQLKNKTIFFILAWMIISVVGTSWNANYNQVHFLTVNVGSVNDLREYSLQDAFVQLHLLVWLICLVLYIPTHILFRVSDSYTVSNTLWLRLSDMNNFSLNIFRCLMIIGVACLFFMISSIWAFSFSLFHNVGIKLLIQPVISLFAFMIMTGGLILWLSPGPTAAVELRFGTIVLISSIPLVLYMFKRSLISLFGNYVPYAYPYASSSLNSATLRASFAAIIAGTILVLLKVLVSYWRFSLSKKNIIQ